MTSKTSKEATEAYLVLGEKIKAMADDLKNALDVIGTINEDLGVAYKERDEAREALRTNQDTITMVRLMDERDAAVRERDAALAKAEEWRKMHSEALGETAKARDDLSIALRALDASRVSEAAWKGMYEAERANLDEAHAALKALGSPAVPVTTPGPCRLCSSDVQPPPGVHEEAEFLPGDLARASGDSRPDSAFWPPVDRVEGGFVWLNYTQDELNCKPETVVRKPVAIGDTVRVWRGPAQGLRGRVTARDPADGAVAIGTDWVRRVDVVAVKP